MWGANADQSSSGWTRGRIAAAALIAAAVSAGIGVVAGAGSRGPAAPAITPVFAAGLDLERLALGAERADPVRPRVVPTEAAIRSASRYAAARAGTVSFATVDSRGRLRGHSVDRRFTAASVVKAMVLAAELRRLARADEPIDGATDQLLKAMITQSDNDAADTVYERIGDAGMHSVARRAGMTGFTIAGHWGNAQITAADLARFFAELEEMFPRRHVKYGQSLLGSVIPSQSWGIPAAAGETWAARLKGGWLPEKALVHQAAELRERGGARRVGMAILTDEQPSHEYGVETVRGVAARLLAAD